MWPSDGGHIRLGIENFDQAIRLKLNPNFASAFVIRGFDQTIRLNPNYAEAYTIRGLAKQAKGDSAGGDADRAKAKQLI